MSDFDVLTTSYFIEGEVVNETPLRIGSGKQQGLSPVDNPVVTYIIRGREIPVIPGSSWKGVLRSEAERFVRSTPGIAKEKNWDVWRACDIFEITDREDLRKNEGKNPCVVCRVFGNTELASHVHLFDSIPKGDPALQVIRRVAIERITSSQSPGRLFDVQVVPPMTRWTFRMRIINVDLESDNPQGYLLSNLLRQLIEGIQIGGGRSVGYGYVRLDPDVLTVRKLRVEDGILKRTEQRGRDFLKALEVSL